jgi:PAS domain S-box-containing protein
MAESDNSVRSTRHAAAHEGAAADNHWVAALRRAGALCRAPAAMWVGVLAFAAALVGWIYLKPASGLAQRLPIAAANIGAPLVSLVVSLPIVVGLWRRRRSGESVPGGDARLASASAFGLTFLMFTGAQCAWYYYELLRQEPPFPSWADAGYLSAYPCLVAAVLLLPARRFTALQRSRVLMDSSATLAAVATFSWYYLLGPAILNAPETPLAKVLAAAYPVADLFVLFCLLLTMARAGGTSPPRGTMALCLGLLVVVVTDVVFGYQSLHGAYVPGTLLDAGWPVGYLLLALGARELTSREPDPSEALPPAQGNAVASGIAAVLPYALVPLVASLVLGTLYEPDDRLVIGVYAGAALIVVLVVLRQILTIRQNAGLYAEVSSAYRQLEQSHRSLEAAVAALAQSEERFRAAAESASDLVYEYDTAAGTLQWFGDIDGRLGYDAGVFPRTLAAWEGAIHPEDRDRVMAALAALAAHTKDGSLFDVEYRVRRSDGTYRHWIDRGRLVGRGGAPSTRMVGVVSDVTERKRAEALEGERAGLRQAVSAMEGVLGVVGHELRTPLAGLRAMSEFLLTDGGAQGAECEQMLSGINEEVVRMSETVNDLLEAARLNSGLAKWKWSRFELGPVCLEALDPIRPLVDEGAVRLECDVEGGCAMLGDADAVRRLVINLVSNARRFTTAGSIRVAARSSGEGGQRWVEVSVTDTGPGIPPEIRDRLGEAFALNAGLVGPNHVSGTGLGLAICKGIALAHGGRLSVQSEVGKGTTVLARLRADLPAAMTEHGKGAVAGLETWAMIRNKH